MLAPAPSGAPRRAPRRHRAAGRPVEPGRHRARFRLAVLAATIAVLALPQAFGQAAIGSADPATLNAYRVAARARAAIDLFQHGDDAAAMIQLDKAAGGPLQATAGLRASLGSQLTRLRAAVGIGDAAAARDAEQALTKAAEGATAEGQRAALVVALVRDASHEGQEAAEAEAGGATEPRAYALAAAGLAGELAASGAVPAVGRDAVRSLRSTIDSHADADAVRAAASTALSALGAPPSEQEIAHSFDAIARDLDLAVKRYRDGDADGASQALIDAYLDNFERLEPVLQSHNPDLMERLEEALGTGLRALVRKGVAAGAFEDAVRGVRDDLAAAREALS